MALETTTITGLPNATTPLAGTERVPMDQGGATKDASTQDIADLANAAIEAAVDAHVAEEDPHEQYLTQDDLTGEFEQAGAAAAAIAAHVEEENPHEQYAQTAADLGLGANDTPTFAGLTITGTSAASIPHIHGSIAGNFYVHVRNTSGAPLAAGTAVYATGSVGDTDRITVAACDPTDSAKMPAIGILETNIANNGNGDAVILGELRPFNTAGFGINQHLYVGSGGVPTGTRPTSGIVQAIGTVARVQSETGTIVVHIGDRLATVATSGVYGDLSGLPSLGGAAALNVGTTAGTVAAGNDARLSTNITYDAATREVRSSTGDDAVLPLVTTSAAGLQPATSFATIAYASTVTLDMAALNGQVRKINVTGPLTLAVSNIADGQALTLRLVIDGTDRTLTVPAWSRYGYNSTTLKANKVYRLAFEIHGTSSLDQIDLGIAEKI